MKIAKAYLELGHMITVVISEKDKEHINIKELFQQYKHTFNLVTIPETKCNITMQSKWSIAGLEIELWILLKKTFQKVYSTQKIDLVLLPYADYCLNAIGLLGTPFDNVAWRGICMRPTFHYKDCGVIAPTPRILHIKRFLFMRVLRIETLSQLFTIDELLADYIRDKHPKLANKLTYLPDPAEPALNFDNVVLRQRYNIPQNAKVVLIYGAIDERKGIFNLLDALESSKVLGNWHALVVGRQSATVREAFSTTRWANLKQANRIHAMDKFVTDEVEHHVLAMCDVVWAAYVGHYTMSGVIVRAGMYRKPVIACEEGLIGWYAKVMGVGLSIDKNLLSIDNVLSQIVTQENAIKFGMNGYHQFKLHNWPNFIQKLIAQ